MKNPPAVITELPSDNNKPSPANQPDLVVIKDEITLPDTIAQGNVIENTVSDDVNSAAAPLLHPIVGEEKVVVAQPDVDVTGSQLKVEATNADVIDSQLKTGATNADVINSQLQTGATNADVIGSQLEPEATNSQSDTGVIDVTEAASSQSIGEGDDDINNSRSIIGNETQSVFRQPSNDNEAPIGLLQSSTALPAGYIDIMEISSELSDDSVNYGINACLECDESRARKRAANSKCE